MNRTINLTEDHRAVIDESLQTFARHEQNRANSIGFSVKNVPSLENLRQSKFGQQLEQLAEIAEQGLLYMGRVQAREILNQVYQTLFLAPFQAHPLINASFDSTPLGRLLTQARARILDLQDVINVTEASKQSGLSRTLLYLMGDVGLLHPIDMNNRQMIERSELERVVKERQQTAKEEEK
jgi:hypothetical protein